MFIDSHCHLDFACFDEGIEALLIALDNHHINKLIIPGTQASRWETVERLATKHDSLYYSLGLHPHFLDSFEPHHLTLLKAKLAVANKHCVALGEIGLDKYATPKLEQQEFVFIEQLKMAQQLELPIILHCVQKQGRVLALLKQYNFKRGGVYHAFSGSLEVANDFIKLGFKLGIGGVITYPNSTKTRNTVAALPIDSLLLETDAPDMPIFQQQAENNSPLNIITIFNCLAELRSESKSQLTAQLYNNAHNIFSLSND